LNGDGASMRVYYHPTVGDYARYPSFEWDYALAGAGISGVGVGAGSYALRKANGGSLLWGLAGTLVGGGIAGALIPKRILSWFNPPPFDAPIRYPRQIPKVVVPSFIGDSGLEVNLLFHEGAGSTVKDYSGKGRHGEIRGASWLDGSYGWSLFHDGVDDLTVIPLTVYGWNEITIEEWIYACYPKAREGYTKFSMIGDYGIDHPSTQLTPDRPVEYTYLNVLWNTRRPDGTIGVYAYNWFAYRNQWVHLVRRFTADREFSVWINGEKKYSATVPSDEATVLEWNPDTATHPERYRRFVLGANSEWLGEYMKCIQAMLRIYSRALGDEEIKHHFESARSIFGV